MHALFRMRRTIAAIAIAGLTAAGLTQAQEHGAPRPNIVVFMLDTVRPDYIGMYGAASEPAPNLAAMAAESVVFENAHSTSSWTPPAVASVFTGQYPTEHGMHLGLIPIAHADLPVLQAHFRIPPERMREFWNAALRERVSVHRIPEESTTLAEALRDTGYRTFATVANPHVSERTGMAQGFDVFLPAPDSPNADKPLDADQILAMVDSVAESARGAEPFFFYVHFLDPHSPYEARAPYYSGSDDALEDTRRRYLSEIAYMDEHLQRVRTSLQTARDTITIVVSDHGEEFEDHGGREHGFTLYRELNRVVFTVHAPGLGLAPGRVPENVSLVDVYPTLAEWLELTDPPAFQGVSLVPVLRRAGSADSPQGERTFFAHRLQLKDGEVGEIWAAMRGNWKLIETGVDETNALLFDRASDPGELYNLAEDHPEIAEELRSQLREFQTSERHQFNLSPIDFDPSMREMLESLGYLE